MRTPLFPPFYPFVPFISASLLGLLDWVCSGTLCLLPSPTTLKTAPANLFLSFLPGIAIRPRICSGGSNGLADNPWPPYFTPTPLCPVWPSDLAELVLLHLMVEAGNL